MSIHYIPPLSQLRNMTASELVRLRGTTPLEVALLDALLTAVERNSRSSLGHHDLHTPNCTNTCPVCCKIP